MLIVPWCRKFKANPCDRNSKDALVAILINTGPSFISMCLILQIFKNFNDLFFALIFKDLHFWKLKPFSIQFLSQFFFKLMIFVLQLLARCIHENIGNRVACHIVLVWQQYRLNCIACYHLVVGILADHVLKGKRQLDCHCAFVTFLEEHLNQFLSHCCLS